MLVPKLLPSTGRRYLVPLLWLIIAVVIVWQPTAHARLPAGTVALYSDGYSQKLLRYENGNSIWEDVRKRQYVYGPHPVRPAVSVWYPFDPEKSYVTEVVDGSPQALTKSSAAESEHIKIERQYSDGSIEHRDWLCESLGSGQSTVVGVTLEVSRYECSRSKLDRKFRMRWKETRLIEYAPSLQLITSVIRERPMETQERTLMFLVPPDQVSAKKIAQLQRQVQRMKRERENAQQ